MSNNGVEVYQGTDADEVEGDRLATALFGLSREQDVAMALWRTLSEENSNA